MTRLEVLYVTRRLIQRSEGLDLLREAAEEFVPKGDDLDQKNVLVNQESADGVVVPTPEAQTKNGTWETEDEGGIGVR